MTSKDGIEILKSAWHDRMDKPNYPNFDDINEALTSVEKDLEVLEILKRIVKIVDYSEYPISSPDNQLVILSGGEIKNVEDYEKIKGWLKNDK